MFINFFKKLFQLKEDEVILYTPAHDQEELAVQGFEEALYDVMKKEGAEKASTWAESHIPEDIQEAVLRLFIERRMVVTLQD